MHLWILTLSKHKDGVWVTRLVQELEKLHPDVSSVKTVLLEEILHEQRVDRTDDGGTLFDDCDGIVNRVSDAADPILAKRCLALLSVATRLYDIPVFNGPVAYSACANKWCHHAMFARAGLASPPTAVIQPSQWNKESDNSSLLKTCQRLLSNQPLPYLLKPNSGGFGAGIVKMDAIESMTNVAADREPITLPDVADDTVLVQQYVPPENGIIYRVWFLCGKVQCAVQRKTVVSSLDSSPLENYNGCSASAGGSTVCHRITSSIQQDSPEVVDAAPTTSTPILTAWRVPLDVCHEIEDMLLRLPLLEDAHAGSVEFLLVVDNTSIDTKTKRLYFDLNLLSTLPIINSHDSDIQQAVEVWGDGDVYNPWSELAKAVVQVLQRK